MVVDCVGLLSRASVAAAIAAACFFVTATSVSAVEGGQSPYIKGFRDFQTGIVPLEPGVHVRVETYYYRGTAVFNAPRLRLVTDINNVSELVSPTIVTPWQFLGGTLALSARFTNSNLYVQRITTTPLATTVRDARIQGWNDIQLTPFLLGWHHGNFHWNLSTSFWLPVGAYDVNRIANTGRNYKSFGPGVGVTYLDPASGWELSGAATVLFNTENPATHYQSGRVLHIDYTLSKQLTPQVNIAGVGYIMQQLTADSGSGATFGENRSRVAAAGPALGFKFDLGGLPLTAQVKYYREFFSTNTSQGNAASLVLRTKF